MLRHKKHSLGGSLEASLSCFKKGRSSLLPFSHGGSVQAGMERNNFVHSPKKPFSIKVSAFVYLQGEGFSLSVSRVGCLAYGRWCLQRFFQTNCKLSQPYEAPLIPSALRFTRSQWDMDSDPSRSSTSLWGKLLNSRLEVPHLRIGF